MIENLSSILWGLSVVFNIILLLIGLPLCLLICCCCKKHRAALEQDVQMVAQNHGLIVKKKKNQKQIAYQNPKKQNVKVTEMNDEIDQPDYLPNECLPNDSDPNQDDDDEYEFVRIKKRNPNMIQKPQIQNVSNGFEMEE